MADLPRRLQFGQMPVQRRQHVGQCRHQNGAVVEIHQPVAVPGAEAQVHPALGVDLDAEARPAPIALTGLRQQLGLAVRGDALAASSSRSTACLWRRCPSRLRCCRSQPPQVP